MADGLDWQRERAHWPHAERSRFVQAAGLRWHVQHWPAPRPGAATWLLLHGTGASTHTWRGLAPLLAPHVGLVAPDLPGHAFTSAAPTRERAGMAGMAHGITALLGAMDVAPTLTIGHSAGAAVALRRALMAARAQGKAHGETTGPVIGLNAALLPLPGIAGSLFSPAAKLMALSPLAARLFSWHAADRAVLARLLHSTGSVLDEAGIALYRRLVESPAHVAGALAMMAQWDLPALAAELPQLLVPLHLIVGDRDGTIPPRDADRVRALLPAATVHRLAGLGHLAHEENAAAVAARLLDLAGCA